MVGTTDSEIDVLSDDHRYGGHVSVPENLGIGVLNFASRTNADALMHDIKQLGYCVNLTSGASWLKRPATQTRADATLVLIDNEDRVVERIPDLLDRLAQKPWICILTSRCNGAAAPLMRASTEFLQAPWSRDELSVRLDRFAKRLTEPEHKSVVTESGTKIVGESPAFTHSLTAARRAAACAVPVIVEGETGTGKELVATLIHSLSARARGPFVPVNCGCLPENLIESELFGHEAGAFTGAVAKQTGLVRQANGGTLFLDEVDALSPRAQIALLRFLQEGEVRPVGGGIEQSDARVVCATNQPLAELVAAKKFRDDLFFRLNVLEIALPPLRERRGDILSLARYFLNRHCVQQQRRGVRLHQEVEAWLTIQDWPGNARELEHLILRALVSTDGSEILLSDIAPAGSVAPQIPFECSDDRQVEEFARAKARAIDAFERRYLSTLMHETGGNVTAAADLAGKERRALGKLLKKHGLGAGRGKTSIQSPGAMA